MDNENICFGANDLICPHCGEKQYSHEPEEFSAMICTTTCEYCGREIEYSVVVERTYYPTSPDDEDEEQENGKNDNRRS